MQVVHCNQKQIEKWNHKQYTYLAGLHVPKEQFFLLVLFKKLFFILLTNAEVKAFNWLKALFSP